MSPYLRPNLAAPRHGSKRLRQGPRVKRLGLLPWMSSAEFLCFPAKGWRLRQDARISAWAGWDFRPFLKAACCLWVCQWSHWIAPKHQMNAEETEHLRDGLRFWFSSAEMSDGIHRQGGHRKPLDHLARRSGPWISFCAFNIELFSLKDIPTPRTILGSAGQMGPKSWKVCSAIAPLLSTDPQTYKSQFMSIRINVTTFGSSTKPPGGISSCKWTATCESRGFLWGIIDFHLHGWSTLINDGSFCIGIAQLVFIKLHFGDRAMGAMMDFMGWMTACRSKTKNHLWRNKTPSHVPISSWNWRIYEILRLIHISSSTGTIHFNPQRGWKTTSQSVSSVYFYSFHPLRSRTLCTWRRASSWWHYGTPRKNMGLQPTAPLWAIPRTLVPPGPKTWGRRLVPWDGSPQVGHGSCRTW